MNNVKNIVFSKDIIDSVSKKLDIPDSTVKIVFDYYFFEHLKEMMYKKDTLVINLRGIGRFFFMIAKGKKTVRSNEKNKFNEVIKHKIDFYEKNNTHDFFRNRNFGVDPHLSPRLITRHFYNGKMSIKELEEHQNNLIGELED